MKKRAVASAIMISLLVTACSSEFDRAMKLGREALKSGEYEEAAIQFDSALIEKPNDSDAIALMDRTEKSIKKERRDAKDEKFKSIFNPIYERLKAFDNDVDLRNDPFEIEVKAVKENLEKARVIREDLDSVSAEWQYIGGDKEALYWNLSEATDGLISAYEYILDPPNEDPSTFPNTRAGRVAAYDNDPRNAVNTQFIRYTTYLDSYKQKMEPAN